MRARAELPVPAPALLLLIRLGTAHGTRSPIVHARVDVGINTSTAAVACGAAAWCRGDVDCTFEQLPVTQRDGITFTVPYYSNAGDITAAGSEDAEIALVVSHGAVPDPGGYFCAGIDAAGMQSGVEGRVIVVAPWYLGTGANVEPTPTQLQWTNSAHSPLSGDWRDGGDSDPAGGRPGAGLDCFPYRNASTYGKSGDLKYMFIQRHKPCLLRYHRGL